MQETDGCVTASHLAQADSPHQDRVTNAIPSLHSDRQSSSMREALALGVRCALG